MFLRSIRWRLTLSYLALTVLILGMVGAISLAIINQNAERQEREYLRQNASALVGEIRLLLSGESREELKELVDMVGFLGNLRLIVRDEAEKVIAESAVPADPRHGAAHSRMGFPPIGPKRPQGDARLFGRLWRIYRYGMDDPEHLESLEGIVESRQERLEDTRRDLLKLNWDLALKSDQNVVVSVGEDDDPLGSIEIREGPDFSAGAVHTAGRAFLLAALLATAVALSLGLFMGKRLTSPIVKLTETARAMGQPDLTVRAPKYGNDEIGELARQFNKMADRLESSFAELARERDALRRFIQDASHELRTPLTALTTFNELLQSRAGKDAAARRDFLKESHSELSRLTWIVGNLLDLTRLDAGLNGLEKDEHSTSELVDEAWQTARAGTAQKNVSLEKSLDLESVYCDKQRMVLVLRNLFDNALKASPSGARIYVSLRRSGGDSVFRIEDEGSGIDPEDISRIFDRFYRSPKNTASGSGLGLSLAKSVVEAHGGTIGLEGHSGKGSCFTVRLPIRGASPNNPEEAP